VKKNKGVMDGRLLFNLTYGLLMIAFLAFIIYLMNASSGYSTPYLLPQRILSLPVPEQIGDLTGSKGIIYAKEPLSFKGPSGAYTVRGYLKASRSLSAAVGVYVRAKNPADDPTCKALTVSESLVYVCERGKDDAKAAVTEFRNVSFASFCSSDPGAYRVVAQGEFWIGVEWDPFLPRSLTLLFDDLAALKVAPLRPHPCASDLR
jgi:hypothetical protein